MKIIIISFVLVLLFYVKHIFAEELKIQNNCGHDVFVGSSGVDSGPFNLGSGQSNTVSMNRESSARVWAQKGCDGGGGNCETTEGYLSLAEMKWDADGMAWYDVSQVDGYNLPITMQPHNPGAGGNCRDASCNFNIDGNCPGDSKVTKDGRAVACKNLNRDDPNSAYAQAIKSSCPEVYSWSGDDQAGMRACNPGNNGFNVIFC